MVSSGVNFEGTSRVWQGTHEVSGAFYGGFSVAAGVVCSQLSTFKASETINQHNSSQNS